MKHLLTLVLCSSLISLSAQEKAEDYMVPSLYGTRQFKQTSKSYLPNEIEEYAMGFSNSTREVSPDYISKSDLGYKFTYYTDGMFYDKDYAYYLKFNNNTATLYGFGQYSSGGLFSSSKEEFKELEPVTFAKIPAESYQTNEFTMKDPETGKDLVITSSYKTHKLYGYERRMLILNYKSGTQKRTEVYMKHFGLIAYNKNGGNYFVADLSAFRLFKKEEQEKKTEKKLREEIWAQYKKVSGIELADSFFKYGSKDEKYFYSVIDTLMGMYEHIKLLHPENINAYNYMASAHLYYLVAKVVDGSKKTGKSAGSSQYKKMMQHYFILRPTVESVSKTGLNKFVTHVDENYYNNYWRMIYFYFTSNTMSSYLSKKQKAHIMKPFIKQVKDYESKIDDVNKCILYSYVAVYHNHLDEEGDRFEYMARSIEYYPKLSDEDKDLNIEYMRSVMKTLADINPETEPNLVRAMKAVLQLNDYQNAVKIATNGMSHNLGTSTEFALLYAKAAYNDDLDKINLRKALDKLKGKLEALSVSELSDYIKYCNALSPEYNCSEAEDLMKKAKKREEDEYNKKQKEQKKDRNKSRRQGAVNFAIMANPFAGLKTKPSPTFKFIPVSAALRVGKIIHEIRYNHFPGADLKNRFIMGRLTSTDLEDKDGWKNLRGQDISYSLIFVSNDKSSYRKSVNCLGGGPQFVYGDFRSNMEQITVKTSSTVHTTTVVPRIKRYEGLLNFHFFTFSRKNHLAFTLFYGLGVGVREITYNSPHFTEEQLMDDDQYTFTNRRLEQSNWGTYLTFRAGFRFGFTIF